VAELNLFVVAVPNLMNSRFFVYLPGMTSLLRSIAMGILSRYLGDFVEGLDANNLRISVYEGKVELSNLKLKATALSRLELPLEVEAGYLGRLEMSIPWSNLSGEAVKIRLEEIYLLAKAKTQTSPLGQELAEKLSRLQLAEILGLDQPTEKSTEQESSGGWTSHVAMKVVDNIQFIVEKVHVRYEGISFGNQYACGITLESLHVVSADENWSPSFVVGEELKRKRVTLTSVAVYFDTNKNNSAPLEWESQAEFCSKMAKLISSKGSNHQYILLPVSGELKGKIAAVSNVEHEPQSSFKITLESIALSIDHQQYCSLLSIMDKFSVYGYSADRLKSSLPKDAMARWRFALNIVKKEIRKKRQQWTWDAIKQRSRDRENYMYLYKQSKTAHLDEEEEDQLRQLTYNLSYDDIILYRKLANAAIKREQKKKKNSGWWSYLAGVEEEDTTEEDWKELYREYAAPAIREAKYAPEFVKTSLKVNVKKGEFTLYDTNTKRKPLLVSGLKGLDVSLSLREAGSTFTLNLASMDVLDYVTLPNSSLVLMTPSEPGKLFFRLCVDSNPLDNQPPVDIAIRVVMKPLHLVYSPKSVAVLNEALTAPPSKAMKELAVAAMKGVEELQSVAATKMKYMLEHRTTILLDVQIQAPRISIPKGFMHKGPAVLIDLGKVIVQHDSTTREKYVEAGVSKKFLLYIYLLGKGYQGWHRLLL